MVQPLVALTSLEPDPTTNPTPLQRFNPSPNRNPSRLAYKVLSCSSLCSLWLAPKKIDYNNHRFLIFLILLSPLWLKNQTQNLHPLFAQKAHTQSPSLSSQLYKSSCLSTITGSSSALKIQATTATF